MKNSLNNLVVDNLIVHDVPKKFSQKYVKENPESDAEDIILSEVPTDFDLELTRFFHDRITGTIGSSNAFEIEFDSELNDSKTQIAIKEYFDIGVKSNFPLQESDSIRLTQQIAIALHDVQTARNPGGMLLFIPCHSNQNNGIAVLKVEREEGVRIQRDSNEHGQVTFNAQHIKNLMLTKKTKLFKIVLFFIEGENIVGYLCDQQSNFENKEVANFFLIDFLGCKLKEEPKVTTKKFFNTASDFINNDFLKDNEKIDMHIHLISELTNNTQTINTFNFAKKYLPKERLQEFMNSLCDKHIPTIFTKDITMIEDKIKKVRYEFECGIKIIGTEDAIVKNITFSAFEDDKTKIELVDRIKKVESK